MAISQVAGQMLKSTLQRDGANLAFKDTANSTPVLFLDITNGQVGVNTSTPTEKLGVLGNASVSGNVISGNILTNGLISATSNITGGNVLTGGLISATGNISGGNLITVGLITTTGNILTTGNITANYYIGNGSQLTGVIASGGQGNTITLGTPTDGNLTANVAYPGWTTSTYVTDGLGDLNQVSLNIANNTFVGNTYFIANVVQGPSPLSVLFTGTQIGNPNSYLWDFGDGTNSTSGASVTKTYSNVSGGTFSVTYTAKNTNGTYSGNAALGAKGSTSSFTRSDYITLYTPTPIVAFTISPSTIDTGSSVTATNNSSLYVETYAINWGDGTTANLGATFTSTAHTFTNSANTDTLYNISVIGTSNTAGANPPGNYTNTATNTAKVYSLQSPSVTANVTTVINKLATTGGVISFRNDTPGAPGNTASFGAQQIYNFQWGDATANSNVNVQSGLQGNPGAANVTHTFALSAGNQAGNIYQTFTSNLWLYTGFSTSPFKSSDVTITVEPETRANFVGTIANTITDATANTGNARVGYIYTDYTGNNRAIFTFQNTSQNSNLANWSWGDSTFSNGVSNVGNVLHTYTTTGAKTVALTANGTPNGISSTAQSNSSTVTGYIFIAANPSAPTNLSGYSNLTIANSSQGTSPLLAAGAQDATGGNIVANGTSVTRFATTTPIATSGTIVNANTATTGTLTAYVNNGVAGNVTFTTTGNTVGSNAALVISADRDLHVANAAVPSYFYKVFSANISCALASLSTGYNNFKMVHTVSGNTNYVGFVKDNLNSAPTLVTSNVVMVEGTAGTYRYISGIPYYNTGSPTVTIANLEMQNFSGQTFRSGDPFILDSGTNYEGSGAVILSQTKGLATINNATNTMLNGSNVLANIGTSSNYTLGNLTANINGSNNSVSTLGANIFNVVGTATTVQLPTKIQVNSAANTGISEGNIAVSATLGSVYTDAGLRITGFGAAANTPAFNGGTNYYTGNVWSGVQTIAGTQESVIRYGVLKHYAVDLSTGYLPVGPDLATGRSGVQYFTFAFRRATMANFDIRLTTTTGIAGMWIAAPGTTIDTGGFSSPTPGFPGPTSTLNGWLSCSLQYNGSGVPGANTAGGGNGTNGVALTGADVVPLNSAIANVGYTMTLGSQNSSNSTGNNILIRIALSSGQTITALSIGDAA